MSSSLISLSAEVAAVVTTAGRSTVAVDARPRFTSSGVIWQRGVIVTADHTIRRGEEIQVALPDGRRIAAELAGRDFGTDLAVLRADTGAHAAVTVAQVQLQPGALVISVGRTPESTAAALGIVSTAEGSRRTSRGQILDSFARLDLASYPHTSGSALLTAAGEFLGIVTTALSRIAPILLPSVTIARIVPELLKRGHIGRGYLGIGLQQVTLPGELKQRHDLRQDSAIIALSVEPAGPADGAGLMIGDVLVAFAHRTLGDAEDLQAALEASAPGDSVSLTILRGGEKLNVPVTIGERPGKE